MSRIGDGRQTIRKASLVTQKAAKKTPRATTKATKKAYKYPYVESKKDKRIKQIGMRTNVALSGVSGVAGNFCSGIASLILGIVMIGAGIYLWDYKDSEDCDVPLRYWIVIEGGLLIIVGVGQMIVMAISFCGCAGGVIIPDVSSIFHCLTCPLNMLLIVFSMVVLSVWMLIGFALAMLSFDGNDEEQCETLRNAFFAFLALHFVVIVVIAILQILLCLGGCAATWLNRLCFAGILKVCGDGDRVMI